ncbi:MAG: hypothetical protein R2823_08940 [Acidimicrobiia bacterium]
MRGKPIAAAVIAFTLVFIGGAAIAGMAGNRTESVFAPATEPASDKATTTIPKSESKIAESVGRDTPKPDKRDDDKDRDTTPPRFSITSPENESHVDSDVVVVKGGVEPGAKVWLGDRRAYVEGDDWSMRVELKEGRNTLTFKAMDRAGNKTFLTLTLFLDPVPEPDTTPPKFWIVSPKNGHETHDEVIRVVGHVEPGAKVFHGDRPAHVDGDDWKIEVKLKKGKNTFTFTAFDEAGNKARDSVTVYLVGDDGEPPRFAITSPADGSETDDRVILVRGTVEPGAKVYYGDRKAHVDGDDWKIEVKLKAGKNTLTFKAKDKEGNKSVATIHVWYVGDDEPGYEFWAAQTYGSCSENPPYDIFYGKGKPGSVVEVGSAWGSGRAEVSDEGHWELKVFFEGAPVGEPFKVIVQASTGEEKHLKFTYTGGDGEH